MAVIRDGYVCIKKGKGKMLSYKNWFLIKHSYNLNGTTGILYLKTVSLPSKYVGKRIRLKVEVIKG